MKIRETAAGRRKRNSLIIHVICHIIHFYNLLRQEKVFENPTGLDATPRNKKRAVGGSERKPCKT